MNSAFPERGRPARRALATAVAAALTLATGAALAQAPAPTAAAPSETAMIRLIRGLIQSGALAKDVGEALLAQAQAEAMAGQQARGPMAAGAAAGAVAAGPAALRPEPGDVRVAHVPQTVRDQLRDEIKTEVMAQARTEGWAAPNEVAPWTKRIRVEGDVRVRNESRLFSANNSNIEIDWAAINAGSGYDVNSNTNVALPPLVNTRQDRRSLWRTRARLGVVADLSEATQAGVRLATGGDDSPVSTTQTLGGGLGKKSIWLDQAWLSHKPVDWLTLQGGRFGNPFMSTDTLFSSDLNFDGVAAKLEKAFPVARTTVFGTVGVIPLEYSADSFPRTSQTKMRSDNKVLFGTQIGADWRVNEANRLRAALAWYDFDNIAGRLSTACQLYAGEDHCSTDWTRPAFMQKGNTLMLLRNIASNPTDPANTRMPQYVGLASRFELLDFNARWDTRVADGMDLRLDANLIRNMAFDTKRMLARSNGGIVNNFGAGGPSGALRSGRNAYYLQATLGAGAPTRAGQWNLQLGYKRIEPDALPDAYNDSSFHLGGTNARGYWLGGSYAFDRDAWFTGRWISSKEVFGPPVAIDLLQVEFNTRF
ncbi:putative porin [Roseateles chitosanitabidus]|uniref:putative porin n=1 Tax=Roseateles chitosanitabidus TaxID=65048 RepID=UPI00082C3184|nr:putative porin [Roseateles chitosanitabidus]